MLIGVGVGLLIAGVIVLVALMSNSASSGSVECTVSRSVGGDIKVTGSGGVDCGRAEEVTRSWLSEVTSQLGNCLTSCVVSTGFNCVVRQKFGTGALVDCTRGDELVVIDTRP